MIDLVISAPYYAKHDYQIRSNIYEASMMAEYYWKLDFNVFCPHMNTAFFGGLIPEEKFLQSCIERIRKADAIAFHPKWKYSNGCKRERIAAWNANIEQFYPNMEDFMKRR
jgi:hypothetical protein